MRVPQFVLRLFITLAFLSPSNAQAQNIVGNTVLEGKRVELLSDGTWRYMPSSKPSSCVAVHSAVEFCGSIMDWTPMSASRYGFDAMFQYDSRYYSSIHVLEVGESEGVDFEYVRRSVINDSATLAGLPSEKITVYEILESSIDDEKTETLVYTAPDGNVDIIYLITTYIGEHHTVYASVWGYGGEYTEAVKAINSLFIESIKLNSEDPF